MTIIAAFKDQRPRKRGTVGGKPVYDFPVRVRYTRPYGSVDDWLNPPTAVFTVIAPSAADAAWWAMHECLQLARPGMSVTVQAIGLRGGVTERYAGPETVIGNLIMTRPQESGRLF